MTKSVKKKLDLIPLLILFVTAAYLLWTHFDGQILFQWKHIIGLALLAITSIVFFVNHKLGVLTLGFTILLGLLGLLSFSPAVTIMSVGKEQTTLLRFQPIFLLWATLHFILSWRYYVGIANANYWKQIKSDDVFKLE